VSMPRTTMFSALCQEWAALLIAINMLESTQWSPAFQDLFYRSALNLNLKYHIHLV
jgi:hypothetical protein